MSLNIENLTPVTKETARELGRRGAEKANAKKKAKKTMKETYEIILSCRVEKNSDIWNMCKKSGIKKDIITFREALGVATVKNAIDGNSKFLEILLMTLGELGKEQAAAQAQVTESNEAVDSTIEALKNMEIEDEAPSNE